MNNLKPSSKLLLFLMFFCASLIASLTSFAQNANFKVVAFYSGTWDVAHISFVNEAKRWFPQKAQEYGFTFEATNNWGNLNDSFLSTCDVVIFLDDKPSGASQKAAFQRYMDNGGGWLGFHVSAFNTNPNGWSWYHNTFLATGAFRTNTWGPTPAVLKVENRNHPATSKLPATFTSAVSEWYGWNNDLRSNSNIQILCSVDPVSFPLGSDPNQSWYSGYYPIVWTNKNYKMLYMNFGHNDIDYGNNNADKSSTFASDIQNNIIIDGLFWAAGGGTPQDDSYMALPGKVCAINYNNMSGVQKENTTDGDCGQSVGYIDAGDWMTYRVDVAVAGKYEVKYRVASESGGGTIRLEEAGGGVAYGAVEVPSTGAWQNWTTITNEIELKAGKQQLGLAVPSGGFNLNYIEFLRIGAPVEIAKIEAEDYAYMSGVETQATTDVGGGLNVGYIDAGDWMSYNAVDIPASGTYTIAFRVASQAGGGNIQLEKAGGDSVYGTIAVPSTGAWQNWTTIYYTVELQAGNQSFGIKALSGDFNLNWFAVYQGSSVSLNSNLARSYNVSNKDLMKYVYPNPFVNAVKIPVSNTGQYVSLLIFNSEGEEVKFYESEGVAEHNNYLVWDGTDSKGQNVEKGLYFYRLIVDGVSTTGKLIKN